MTRTELEATTTHPPKPRHSPLRSGFARQEGVVLAVLLALMLAFTIAKPDNFATVPNLQNLARDAAVLLILCVGITYVTVMGMFDLSIGSVLVFSQVVALKTMGAIGGDGITPALIGLVVGVAGGAAWGLLNGVLVARLDLSPFI